VKILEAPRRRPAAWLASVVSLLILVVSARVSAQEPTLLSQGSGGVLELEGERRLEITGFRGTLSVRLGKERELRFAARAIGGEEGPVPVELWLDGQLLRLDPQEGTDPLVPLRIEVAVGPELDLGIDVSDCEIQLAGLHGAIDVRGSRIRLNARAIDGSLELAFDESSGTINGVSQGVRLEGRALDVRLENVDGPVSLAASGKSEIHAKGIRGVLEAEVEETELSVALVTGRLSLEVGAGAVTVDSCSGGGELRLAEAPLDLRGSSGAFHVETDAEVRFKGHDGPLSILGRGSAVRGAEAKGGPLEIETDGAEVRLEQVESKIEIRGSDLEINVTDCKGDLTMKTVYSTILVERCEVPVAVENEFGDIEIRGASKLVRVVSRDGNVTLAEFKGTADVKAEGPLVAIDWVSFTGEESSAVENARGDVRVTLPMDHRCQIDAQAPRGRVETDIDELTLSEDGHFAAGLLRGGRGAAPYVKRPSLRLKSTSGDLYLHAGAAAAEAGP